MQDERNATVLCIANLYLRATGEVKDVQQHMKRGFLLQIFPFKREHNHETIPFSRCCISKRLKGDSDAFGIHCGRAAVDRSRVDREINSGLRCHDARGPFPIRNPPLFCTRAKTTAATETAAAPRVEGCALKARSCAIQGESPLNTRALLHPPPTKKRKQKDGSTTIFWL